jgi:dTDP-4-amino-4,6-dideoxygalactose transaminase
LVDCGADHMMDPASATKAVTKKTKAIMPTQLNGRTCNMDAIGKIVADNKLVLLEDAAQALGSKFKGRDAGTFGVAGTISFYPAKTLGCFGDGGAILCNDPTVGAELRLLRDHGRDEHGEVVRWGLNSRLDNFQAAILLYKLKTYPAVISRRRKIASMYQEMLGSLPQLQLPPAPDSDERYFDIYQNYELEAEKRNELKKYLADNGIGTLIQWGGKAVHQWAGLGYKLSLPYTEKMFERCLMLPLNMSMSDDDVLYVAEKVRAFY